MYASVHESKYQTYLLALELMEKHTFHEHLARATFEALKCARELVHNRLPDSIGYMVHLSVSYDGNPLEPGEHVYPEDVARHGKKLGPLATEGVVELLWRDGLVPEWIDIAVARTDGTQTFMELLCCGRFTDSAEHLYYSGTEVCPFGVKSPYLPPDWEKGDVPFDLHWHPEYET